MEGLYSALVHDSAYVFSGKLFNLYQCLYYTVFIFLDSIFFKFFSLFSEEFHIFQPEKLCAN